jgi:TonB family protein
MAYLLQVSTIWIVLFAIYFFGLRGLTFFNHNRIYLLFSLLLGLILPALAPMIEINKPAQISFSLAYEATFVPSTAIQQDYTWKDIIYLIVKYIYWGGVLFMASRLATGLYGIYKMYDRGEKVIKDKLEFVYNEKPHLPFSFLNKIFLSKATSFSDQINHIIHHEITHVQQKHTWDVLFIEFSHVFFWFNPILVFYKKAMKDAHEYIADRAVISDQNKTSYINLLFNATESDLELGLVNSFFNSQLLNRIKMMDSPRSQKSHMIKYLIIIPCLVGFTYLLASSKNSKSMALATVFKDTADTIPANTKQVNIEEKVVDEVPNFIGGQAALFKYLASNIKYPANARANNIEGKALVSFTVNLEGKVEDAKIIKSVNKEIDEEALRVINEMNVNSEGWIPAKLNKEKVRSSFTLPIVFKLQNDGNNEEVKTEIAQSQPLYILDGIEVESNLKIDDEINPNDIESVNVIKGENAIQKYGDKGKNGVILIQTKSAKGVIKNKSLNEVVVVGMKQSNSDQIYDFVGEKPVFPGGDEALFEHLGNNIKYPEEARKNKIEGRVIVKFVVMKDGSIADAKVVRGIGAGCDEEALRVIRTMPKWTPGIHNGNAVNVTYTLPLSFKLESNTVNNKSRLPMSPDDKIYDFVAEKPVFPGGEKALFEYIGSNIRYPEAARTARKEGRVIVKFVVLKDGTVADVNVEKGLGQGFDEEALRVINSMPNWVPGKNNGEPVNVSYTLPINFKLEVSSGKKSKHNVGNSSQNIVVKEIPSTSGKLIFDYTTTDLSNVINVSIVDISGRVVAQTKVKNIKQVNTIEIPISVQNNGLLIVNVKQGTNTTNAKVSALK